MRGLLRSVLVTIGLTLLAGCGGGATVIASTPAPDPHAHAAFVAPAGRLALAAPASPWTPGMYGDAAAGKMLSDALAAHPTAMIVLGSELAGAEWEERAVRMVKAAAPGTSVVARARGSLDRLLEERGEIPYRVTHEQGGVDAYGQPYFVPREHPLSTEWLLKKKALKGAEAMLTVRRVRPSAERMEELRRAKRGGCIEALAELDRGRAAAAAAFADLERQADAALAESFRRQLGEALPFLDAELERARADGSEPGCAGALGAFLDAYRPCLDGACALAPKFRAAAAGGIVAMDDGPAAAVPPRCAGGAGGRDYVGELRAAAGRAAAETFDAFPAASLSDVARFAAFEDAAARLADFCAARHRRYAEPEIASFNADVRALFEALASADVRGEIAAAAGLERIPGLGPARVLARVLPVGTDPRAAGAGLFDRLAGAARCASGTGDDILQASVISVGTSEVAFMGLFFEEQLLCGDLPPARP